MAGKVQLQFRETNATLPDTYTLPADMELEMSAVKARIDGAGASGTFIPCLSILSQDGKLMARVRIDQEFAVADTGDCTWAPFLKRQVRSTGGLAAFQWMRRRKLNQALQVIGSGSETTVTWNSSDVSDASFFTSSGNGIRVEQAGLYSLVCRLFWDSDPGAHAIMFNGVDPDAFAGYPGGAVAQSSFNLIGMAAMDARLASGQTVTVTVRHTAGANRSLSDDGSYLELRFLGDITTTGRDNQ